MTDRTASDRPISVVIETPKGSHNKLKWDPGRNAFRLSHVLLIGMTFPFDFGFVPGTLAGDGDPLDVLVLMDSPCPTGCLVDVRLHRRGARAALAVAAAAVSNHQSHGTLTGQQP